MTTSNMHPPDSPMVFQRSSSVVERSGSDAANGSRNTSAASSKLTPCFLRLLFALFSSHSKSRYMRACMASFCIYGKRLFPFPSRPTGDGRRPPPAPRSGPGRGGGGSGGSPGRAEHVGGERPPEKPARHPVRRRQAGRRRRRCHPSRSAESRRADPAIPVPFTLAATTGPGRRGRGKRLASRSPRS